MPDGDVTLEDLQRVDRRLQVLEAAVKELARLQKIQDDFSTDNNKNLTDEVKARQDAVKKLDGRVGELEKKVHKK